MQVTIETDAGRFTAESIAEARKIERKAKAEESRKRKEAEANHEMARLLSKSNGYDFLYRAASGKEWPRGWIFHPVGNQYSPCRQVESDSWGYRKYEFDGEKGRAIQEFWSESIRLVGTIENGAGFTKAIIVETQELNTGEWMESCMALGIFGDQIAVEPVPGITKEMFARD